MEWVRIPLVQPIDKPMGANQLQRIMFTSNGRGHAIVAREKRQWQESAFYAWKQHRTTTMVAECTGVPCDVTIDIGFRTNRRRDPHNYVSTVLKWVIDGLVLAGAWPDDNPRWITTHEPVLSYHRGLRPTDTIPCAVLLHPREDQNNGQG